MFRFGRRLAFTAALALLTLASAGFARASIAALDTIADTPLQSSPLPALLGPINELGRNGWQCFPEQAAKSPGHRGAELPSDDGSP
jgi:hypothetical protein